MSEKEKREIIEWIRAEQARGEALNITAVKRRRPDLIRQVFATRPFWGWRQALEDAGISYEQIRVELQETVKCEICGLEGGELGAHLRMRHGLSAEAYRERFPGAEMSSETRRAGMIRRAKRHLLPHWEPLYSDEYMMDRAARYRQLGNRLSSTWILENDHNLWQHVSRSGQTWRDFVNGLGFDYEEELLPKLTPAKEVSAEEIIAKLRQWAEEAGHSPTHRELSSSSHWLTRAALHRFGSIKAAVEAAGLPPRRLMAARHARMDPEEARGKLLERAAAGLEMDARALREEDRALHYAVVEQLGGYLAVRKSLLPRKKKPRAQATSVLLPPEEVAEKLGRRAAAGLGMRFADMHSGQHRDPVLLHSARAHHGSLRSALEAVGLVAPRPPKPEKVRKPKPEPKPKKQIKAKPKPKPKPKKKAKPKPTTKAKPKKTPKPKPKPKKKARPKPKPKKKALRPKAKRPKKAKKKLVAREKAPRERKPTRLEKRRAQEDALAAAIRARQEVGLPLRPRAVREDPEGAALAAEGKRLYNSWVRALAAAGVEAEAKPAATTRSLPTYRKHQTVTNIAVRRRRAAAGLEPREGEPRIRMAFFRELLVPETKEAVIETLQARAGDGLTNVKGELWRGTQEEQDLVTSALAVFGGWHAALKAAGMPGRGVLPTRERVIEEIRRLWAVDDELVTVSGMLSGDLERRRLFRAILKEFGSIHKGRVAAGVVPPEPAEPEIRIPRRRGRKKKGSPEEAAARDPGSFEALTQMMDAARLDIIERIRQRQASGGSLRYQAMVSGPMARRDPDLYRSASKLFGSWNRALRAAGIDKKR